jgi:membrane-associated protease RseP (regulator of RpoE activity)
MTASNSVFRGVWGIVLLLSLATVTAFGQGKAGSTTKDEPSTGKTKEGSASTLAYLGVMVDAVPAALSRHIPDVLPSGQGVLVVQVAEGSPAAKSGLKVDDILVRYDDQKLLTPEQLAMLVHADKPQRTVALELVRGGKLVAFQVELGSQDRPPVPSPSSTPARPAFKWTWHFSDWLKRNHEQKAKAPWERFDSLTMKKIGENKFKVDVSYLSKAGKIKRHTFEGTREEIHKAIEGEKDLPDEEKLELLDSLDLPDGLPAEFRELLPMMRDLDKWPGRF